ncbi:MAG: CsbD family protein [Acidimicrobiales bacterium]
MTNRDKTKNVVQITKGKVNEAAGKATGDDELEADGKADQMEGNLKQAGEKVKDAFKK